MFGFCMARTTTCIMRIVWACYPKDISVAIAAQIFVSVGVLLVLVINLIFAQRILRAAHPRFGWHKQLSHLFTAMYALILIILAMVITVTVQSFYTLDLNIKRIDRDLQLVATTYFTFISFLPIPMVVLGLIIPRKTRVEKFGTGRWRSKVTILLTSATLLCLGAAFRTGTSFGAPRPSNDPAWYQARWCFYFFNITVEVAVVYLYIVLRVDRRFHIPNGSKGPGDYVPEGETHGSATASAPRNGSLTATRIMSEEQVFDDKSLSEEEHGAEPYDEERQLRS